MPVDAGSNAKDVVGLGWLWRRRRLAGLSVRDPHQVARAAVLTRRDLLRGGLAAVVLPAVGPAPPRPGQAGGYDVALDNNGMDWGARITTADAQLGALPAVIEVRGGGKFLTAARLSPFRTLRLGPGLYTKMFDTTQPMIYLSNHTAVEGLGWDTILQQSGGGTPWSHVLIAPSTGEADYEVASVRNMKIQGVGGSLNPAVSALMLGNLRNGVVEGIFGYALNSIAVNFGGYSGSAGTLHAQNCILRSSVFELCQEVVTSIVNGRDITLKDLVYRNPGQYCYAAIDLEPNDAKDILERIDIDVLIDFRGKTISAPIGVIVQGHPGHHVPYGPITMRASVHGGLPSPNMAQGISVLAHHTEMDLLVHRSYVSGFTQGGIVFQEVRGARAVGNVARMATGREIWVRAGSRQCRILENDVMGGTILEQDAGTDGNTFLGNVAGALTTVGPTSTPKPGRTDGNMIR